MQTCVGRPSRLLISAAAQRPPVKCIPQPISSLIFTGGRGAKVRNFASILDIFAFESPAFRNRAIYPKSKTNSVSADDGYAYDLAKFGRVQPTHPMNRSEVKSPPLLKLAGENVLNH